MHQLCIVFSYVRGLFVMSLSSKNVCLWYILNNVGDFQSMENALDNYGGSIGSTGTGASSEVSGTGSSK